jgi:hypothetical protein
MDAYRYDYTSFIHTFDLHFTQEGSKCETGGVRREKIQIPLALWANGDDEHRYVVELTLRSWAVIRRRGVILLNTVTPMYVYGNSDNRRFKFTFGFPGHSKVRISKI